MIITAGLMCLWVAEGLLFTFVLQLWPIGVSLLLLACVLGYGLNGMYQRQPQGARLVSRMMMLVMLELTLLMLTIPLWVPLICKAGETATLSAEAQACAATDVAGCLVLKSRVQNSLTGQDFTNQQCIVSDDTGLCVINPHEEAIQVQRQAILLLSFFERKEETTSNPPCSCLWFLPSLTGCLCSQAA